MAQLEKKKGHGVQWGPLAGAAGAAQRVRVISSMMTRLYHDGFSMYK